jgi:hypothetical protein
VRGRATVREGLNFRDFHPPTPLGGAQAKGCRAGPGRERPWDSLGHGWRPPLFAFHLDSEAALLQPLSQLADAMVPRQARFARQGGSEF